VSPADDLFALVKRAVAEALTEQDAARSPGRYLTIATAAHELSVSTRTVRRWVRTGELRTVRVGRQHRIERAELERFQREHSGGSASTAEIDEQARRLLRLVPAPR